MPNRLADAVKRANRSIIGLPAGPWDHNEWPTEGYDGPLILYDWTAAEARPDDPFAGTGATREEWLALADEMIARWAAWKQHIETLGPPS